VRRAASRGYAAERARHFLCNALHGARADTTFASDFENALTGPQLDLDAFLRRRADTRPTKRLARLYGPFKPGVNALPDHAPLELCKGSGYVEHQATGGRRCVD
jgi:hypothetical protein